VGEEAGVTTFEEARLIAAQNLSMWFLPEENFAVKPYGWENGTEYWLLWGVDDKFAAPGDGPYPIVNKLTGEYREESGAYFMLPDAVEVGVWPVWAPATDPSDLSMRPEDFALLEEL
jgi:hypothetical protein